MVVRSIQEIKNTLFWLENKIKTYEIKMAYEIKMEELERPVTWLKSARHEDSRREYAGWLAEHALLEKILKIRTEKTK